MSDICLHFNIARNDTFKIARFRNPEIKNQYVDAEFQDPKCIQAYLAFQAADHINRKELANQLDLVRYNFYLKWKRQQDNILYHSAPGDYVA